jgi:hypothetical protein
MTGIHITIMIPISDQKVAYDPSQNMVSVIKKIKKYFYIVCDFAYWVMKCLKWCFLFLTERFLNPSKNK